jgi:O-antigen/teichoic acid export membrane protein
MVFASFIIAILCRIVYSIYIRYSIQINPQYSNLPTSILREIMIFSFWIFVSNIVGQLYNATDTVMMGAIPALATVGVAVYSVGNTFNSIVLSITIGISSLLSPRVNKMVFSGVANEELTDLSIRIGRLQGYIFSLIVSGFVAFGQPFIQFYAGSGYEDAYWVAILMMIPNMIPLVQSVCLNVIVAKNKHKFRSLVYLGIAIANVIGTWFLMQLWGVIGAALMTGLALIIGQGVIMNWYYHNKTGLNMIRFWKEVGPIYLIPFILCILTLFLSSIINFYQLSTMLIGIIIYTLVFCLLTWLFVFNSYEKELFSGMLFKFIKRR